MLVDGAEDVCHAGGELLIRVGLGGDLRLHQRLALREQLSALALQPAEVLLGFVEPRCHMRQILANLIRIEASACCSELLEPDQV